MLKDNEAKRLIVAFLERATLRGSECEAYAKAMEWLGRASAEASDAG